MTQITLKINEKSYTVDPKHGPDVSLNEYIRTVADLRGTKAMCHEGGCGACVVAARIPDTLTGEVKTLAVNSCLVSVLSCHGWEILTVEGIGNRTKGYHQIQARLAKFNGTQCGYCTPGWIMNMYSLHEAQGGKLTKKEIENSFAGNICRCTGYRSIADAFKTFATDADKNLTEKLCDLEDLAFFKPCGVKCSKRCSHIKRNVSAEDGEEKENWCVVQKNDNKMIVVDAGTHKWYKVFTLDDVYKAMGDGNDYKLIAGNTGQGVFHVTDYPNNVIDISDVTEINGYSIDVNLILGAGMPLSEMMTLFLDLSSKNDDFFYLKELFNHMDLVAHIPVRNIGTIGGNLFMKHEHKDFQSDVFLLFETVGAILTIGEIGNKKSEVSLIEFLKMNMKEKILINVKIPPLSKFHSIKTYKIMPRSQNAHAHVNAGFLFKFDKKNIIEKATLVYGAISAEFNHATETEKLLIGKDLFKNETLQEALNSLASEINPEHAPAEPTPSYRKMLALCLFYKAVLSLCPEDRVDPRLRSGGTAIKRMSSQGMQTFDTDKSLWPLNQPIPKIEALVQCSGEATFANDLPTETDELYGSFVLAKVTPGSEIDCFDTTEAFKLEGVVAFYTASDIPGDNNFMPSNASGLFISESEEILCTKSVKFYGQPVGIVVATREKNANKAANLIKVKYSSKNVRIPIMTIDNVLNLPDKSSRLVNNMTVEPSERGNDVKCVVEGEYVLESQYHYTMEPHTTVAKPTEDGMEIYSSTQWTDLPNIAIAQSIKVPVNSVNVIVRRVGGGYGGKITRPTQIACAAALVAHLQGKTCRFILPLQTMMKCIGKRLPTKSVFDIGVNKEGEIQYLKNTFYQDNGCSHNETITPITIHHFLSCYNTKRWYMSGNSVLTDTASNTWCRSPASCEGVAMIEHMMERIAYNLGKDPTAIRILNMRKENNPLPAMIDQFKKDVNFDSREQEVKKFNQDNKWKKRAIKLLPMIFEIFYFGNYASTVSIYHGDGSIAITHGGIEMGQGLNSKVAQVCAHILGVPLDKISVKPSTSFNIPNSMTTGGSIGSECVSFSTIKACETLLERLKPTREKMNNPTWEDLIEQAHNEGVDLQASYMYSALKDGLKPYDVFAIVILEIEVDILTGNHDILRVDLLEDVGQSLSPEIDVGQIEGAFVMGLGYWTSEKLIYDNSTGELITDRTWTYKPPGIKDIPMDMRIYFQKNSKNPFGVLQSKATGEPAFCLAVVVTHALREAVRAARLDSGLEDQWVHIPNPCTAENIFMSVEHNIKDFKLK